MKTLTLTVFLSFFCISMFSQKNMEDVVYLKNGSRIAGSILQIIPDSMVQIKQAGGSVWNFSMREVSLIAKEEKLSYKATISDGKGYQFGFDAGFLIGTGSSRNKAPLSVSVLNSYRIWPNFAAGIGAGLEFFRTTQVPVYLDTRLYFNRKFYSPYLFFQGGAMLPLGDEEEFYTGRTYKGKIGFMVNPGMGFLIPLNEKSAFSIGFSYRYHELLYENKKAEINDFTMIERMNRFNLKFGLLFR